MKALYVTEVTAHGGRDGRAESADGKLKVSLGYPPELGGPAQGQSTNPEQLFAAGYAACFESAIRFVARQQKIALKTASVRAEVSLYPDGPGFKLGVLLRAQLPELDRKEASALLEEAHRTCPYSKATRGNIDVKVELAD